MNLSIFCFRFIILCSSQLDRNFIEIIIELSQNNYNTETSYCLLVSIEPVRRKFLCRSRRHIFTFISIPTIRNGVLRAPLIYSCPVIDYRIVDLIFPSSNGSVKRIEHKISIKSNGRVFRILSSMEETNFYVSALPLFYGIN